jgi:uncharacterized protein (TIGR00369 family)
MPTNIDAHKQQQILQQLSQAFSAIPFNQMLGLRLDHISADHVIMSFSMKNDLIGNFLYGILHGGVISSVLDMAGGMAVMAAAIHKHKDAPPEELVNIIGRCSTIDLQVSFISPGKGDLFTAKAWLSKNGHHISFTRMELQNEEDVLIATASGTYLIK